MVSYKQLNEHDEWFNVFGSYPNSWEVECLAVTWFWKKNYGFLGCWVAMLPFKASTVAFLEELSPRFKKVSKLRHYLPYTIPSASQRGVKSLNHQK